MTDPLGHVNTYTYDELSRVTQVTDHLDQAWQFVYDSSDNLLSKTDPNGNATAYTYDALNRLSSVTDALGNITRYSYDGNGNLLIITDANNHTAASHDFDPNNRPIASRDGLDYETQMSYSAAGRLLSRTNADGDVTTYDYDALTGRMTRITYTDTRQELLSYDRVGNLLAVSDTQTGAEVRYTYDASTGWPPRPSLAKYFPTPMMPGATGIR